VLLGAACLLLWWRQRAQAAQALADARHQICRLAASQHGLRDAERRRIARDLHDDLGQHLLALGLDLGTLAAGHPACPPLQACRSASSTPPRLRAIIHDLPPRRWKPGLEGAVQQQIAQFSRLSGIRCRLDAEPEAFATPDGGIEAVLYRVLQESLSNIVRHAQASEVCVGLCRQEHCLSLTVRDNGVGLPQPGARRGHGLRGIAQRVARPAAALTSPARPARARRSPCPSPFQ
jgi:signal transduction histidine kinase